MRYLLNLNSFVLIVLAVSLGLFIYPIVVDAVRTSKAEDVLRTFRSIAFSLNLYFYTEGFEMIRPSRVDIKTLVKRYYLRTDPGDSYRIFWIDPKVEDDGKVVALVYFTGSVDPVAMSKVLRSVVWFSNGRVSLNYRPDSHPGMRVEIRKTW